LDVWTSFLSTITLGIAIPFMLCKKEKWLEQHTFIEGRQLTFCGTGFQLFGQWMKWLLLTMITLGINSFFIPISVKKCTVSHTKFKI
jgi:uncharacterized membrane protein YjgN (DUF898 family)